VLQVSQLAASVLFRALQASEIPTGLSLRLTKSGEQFVLQVDSPAATDRVVRYEGAIVLTVDKDLEKRIGDARIDVEETHGGHDLVMRRPGNTIGIRGPEVGP